MGARITVFYRDEEKAPDTVKLGAFAQIAAKRRLGLEAIKEGDPEAALYGVLVELHGPAEAARTDFDAWLLTVEDFKLEEANGDTADPTQAETSSPPWPDSPPTSE